MPELPTLPPTPPTEPVIPPNPVIVIDPPKPVYHFPWWTISLASFMIFIVIAGYLFYQNQILKTQLATQPSPTVTPTPLASVDPTATWQTYTNELGGYSIKYPSSFATEVITAGGESVADPSTRNLFIYKVDSTSHYNERYINLEVAQLEPSYDQGNITQTTLNGYLAKKISLTTAKFDIYSIKTTKDTFIEIYVANEISRKMLANQILSTFKFTDQAPAIHDDKTQLGQYLWDHYYNQGKQYGKTMGEVETTINKLEGNYATGTGGFTSGGGDVWFATKVNGDWQIVEQTQEPPSCAIMTQYSFPKNIYGECINK